MEVYSSQGQNPRMDWESKDLPNAFKSFKSHAEFMFGGPLQTKTEEVKCNYLMIWAGEKGRQIFSTWNLQDDDKKKLESYLLYSVRELLQTSLKPDICTLQAEVQRTRR